jgi:hypothetical protein
VSLQQVWFPYSRFGVPTAGLVTLQPVRCPYSRFGVPTAGLDVGVAKRVKGSVDLGTGLDLVVHYWGGRWVGLTVRLGAVISRLC